MCLQMTGIMSWIVRSWTDVENNIVSVERVKEYDGTLKEVGTSLISFFIGKICFSKCSVSLLKLGPWLKGN